MKKLLLCIFLVVIAVTVYSQINKQVPKQETTLAVKEQPAAHSTVESRTVRKGRPNVGQIAVIHDGDGGDVLVAVDEASHSRLIELAAAMDKQGILQMILRGKVFMVKGGTQARVLQTGFRTYEIRVTEGPQDGKGGIVSREFVHAHDPVAEKAREDRERKAAAAAQQQREAEAAAATAEKRERQRAEKQLKQTAEDEKNAAAALNAAKNWIKEGDKDLAAKRLEELLKRYPDSSSAAEAKRLLESIRRGTEANGN